MFENIVPDDYGLDSYVIEVGNQICIMADGTTGNKKTVQVLLALKIEDVVNEYIFSFVINDYKIRKMSQ